MPAPEGCTTASPLPAADSARSVQDVGTGGAVDGRDGGAACGDSPNSGANAPVAATAATALRVGLVAGCSAMAAPAATAAPLAKVATAARR